ncbi:MAG: DNA polymerase III subunit delta' [Eggerthellaceae bacterium]|jgi:DNA polymerase-3 subunit delta'|nr:DNA polymerase III subunit delta' [Eggerthellaceae bacterium]
MADVFERILGQPNVRTFLRSVIANDRVGQSYLFTGPAGSNKTLAAYAFSQAIICSNNGCGTCDDCRRIMRRRHPDVRYFAPEGAKGYLVSQIRSIVEDVDRAPIRASRKIYIIDRVDLLGVQAANAFLKTLEEPPEDVVIILLGRTVDSVLPTIVSRCQTVPFRHIPAHEACGIIRQNTGALEFQAVAALQACDGSISRAIEFVRSNERMGFRTRVLEIVHSLALADDLDVLQYASELVKDAQAPLDVVRAEQEKDLSESSEYLAKSAIRQIEQKNKRALSARSIANLHQLTAIVRSWLRDVLIVCGGASDLILNEDVRADIEYAAVRVDVPALVYALHVTDETDDAITYNVSPETCIDVLMLQIREALYGTNSASKAAI